MPPHDRGHRGHGTGVAEPALPDRGRTLDRIERQIHRLGHSHKVPAAPAQIHPRPARHVLDTHVYSKLYSVLGEHVTEARSGGDMRSGHAVAAIAPVLAAGVGVRQGGGWAIRSASFRLERSELGGATLGIVSNRPAASAALIGLLSGRIAPEYGSLRVLGQDMSAARGRSQVRRQVGIARRNSLPQPAIRIRGLVERAARLARQPGHDRHLLVAAILDRLALTAWADVPVRSAPDLVVARARLAAAAVHQPNLLLIDGLLDNLPALDRGSLVGTLHDLERDTAIISIGRDNQALTQACREVLTLTDAILVGSRPESPLPAQPQERRRPEPAFRD